MNRLVSIATLVGLSAALASAPLHAAEPKPSIEDPLNDANFVNDQGTGDGSFGDVDDAGTDASAFADIELVTFTTDKKNLYVHIRTESTAPPSTGEGFRVRTNPDGPGGVYCLNFEVFFPGAQNDLTAWKAHLRDACAAGSEPIEGEGTVGPLGAVMITIPRAGIDALKKGATLTAPQAATFVWSGSYPTGVAGPYLDTTKPGMDYKLK
ncbi:MAG: hypothetical protein ACRDJI_03425 [Actinomycetota bacterium]